jgi:hypothetical protein
MDDSGALERTKIFLIGEHEWRSVVRIGQTALPAVARAEAAMKEQIVVLPGNLKADKNFTRKNGLKAMAAELGERELHELPACLCLEFFVRQFVVNGLQVLIHALQARARRGNGPEDGSVIDFDAGFGPMFEKESLNVKKIRVETVLARMLSRKFELIDEIVPGDVAGKRNRVRTFPGTCEKEIGGH